MKAILTGGTGMVGGLILQQCLNDERVTSVISLVRKPSGATHPKLQEVAVADFTDYSEHAPLLKDIDMAFFCIGVYTGQVADELFKQITVDYAVEFAKALKENSPGCTYCLLSGNGADRTEQSRTSFARYKGMAENQIHDLGLKFHTFRPAYIYPVTPRQEPNFMYTFSRWLYPVIRLLGENGSIKSTELASAMFNVGIKGTEQEVLENKDILKLA
ncbi:MAG: NAD(P)H-binding protein [Bacteroidota bacterium]